MRDPLSLPDTGRGIEQFSKMLGGMSRRITQLELAASRNANGRAGIVTATTSALGRIAVTFGAAFDYPPAVTVTPLTTSTTVGLATTLYLDPTVTGFEIIVFDSSGTRQNSTSVKFHWQALAV